MTRYICDCEKLELARAYYCAACNAYKQLEAELETERRLSFRNQVAQLEAERDALVKALEAITRRVPIMGSNGDYREGQLHALEACSEVARAAIDAARGKV